MFPRMRRTRAKVQKNQLLRSMESSVDLRNEGRIQADNHTIRVEYTKIVMSGQSHNLGYTASRGDGHQEGDFARQEPEASLAQRLVWRTYKRVQDQRKIPSRISMQNWRTEVRGTSEKVANQRMLCQ